MRVKQEKNIASQDNGMEQDSHDNTGDITERIVMTTESMCFRNQVGASRVPWSFQRSKVMWLMITTGLDWGGWPPPSAGTTRSHLPPVWEPAAPVETTAETS